MASAFLATEKSFRKIIRCEERWMLEACLNESPSKETMDGQKKAG